MKIETIKQISLQDWNELIENTYGKPYNFQQQDGCKPRGIETIETNSKWAEDFENTEIPFEINGEEMGVSLETWLNTSPEDTAKHFNPEFEWENELFWERNFYPEPNILATDLCKRGLLEKGEYQIKIDW